MRVVFSTQLVESVHCLWTKYREWYAYTEERDGWRLGGEVCWYHCVCLLTKQGLGVCEPSDKARAGIPDNALDTNTVYICCR